MHARKALPLLAVAGATISLTAIAADVGAQDAGVGPNVDLYEQLDPTPSFKTAGVLAQLDGTYDYDVEPADDL